MTVSALPAISVRQNRSPVLEVTLHYSPSLVRRAVFAYLRRGLGAGIFVALAGLVAAAIFLTLTEPGSWLAVAIWSAVAVVSVLLFGLYILHYRHGMEKLKRMREPQAVLQLTDLDLVASSQAGSFTAPWSSFAGIWRFPEFWLLLIG